MAKKYKFGRQPMIVWYGKLFYSSANMGIAFVTQTFTGFILFYGTIVCRVPAYLMGLAFSIGTLWDAISDPIGGYITDNTKSRLFGKRHGYIIASTFIIAAINIMLWSVPPDMSVAYKFVWLSLMIIFMKTFETLFSTPYAALGVELSGDYNEQTVIQSYKSVFFLLGTIFPTIIMALLQANPAPPYTDGRYDPSTYLTMAYISSIIMLVTGFICYIGTYSHVPRLNKKAQLLSAGSEKVGFGGIIKEFLQVIKVKNYRAVILGYAVAMVASAFLTGVGMYMFTYTFKVSSTQMYILLGSLFVATILSQPLWSFLSNKMDKKPALILGMVIAIVGILGLFAVFLRMPHIPSADTRVAMLLPFMAIAGVGVGSLYPLPYSIMADIIAYDIEKTGKDKTATFTAFMTFAFKVSQSATLLIIGVALELIGFRVPSGTGEYLPPLSAQLGLGYIFFAGVVISLVAGAVIISRYSLKKKDIPNAESVMPSTSFEIDRLLSVIDNKTNNKTKKQRREKR